MSRFAINAFMHFVESSDAEVRAYSSDPAGYVAAWEARAAANRLPTADSGSFTPEERAALASRDHAALYRLGAHPYLLWHFVEAIRVWTGEVPWIEMTRRFRDDVAGIPDPGHAT